MPCWIPADVYTLSPNDNNNGGHQLESSVSEGGETDTAGEVWPKVSQVELANQVEILLECGGSTGFSTAAV